MPEPAATDHWIATPAGRLFARAWTPAQGEGAAPVLLFHDSLGCVALWRDFPARLAQRLGRRVVAYDRLGFGRSDAHPGRLGADFIDHEAATAVPALRAALGLERFVALGHSVGGAMAVTAGAASGTTGCEAVVTVAAQAFVEDRTRDGILAAAQAFADPEPFARLGRHHGGQARWVLEAWTQTWLSPAFAGWTLEPALRRLRSPLLALHGDRDEYGSAAHPQRLAALAGGPARAVLLEDCGHIPHRERPQALLDAVAGFLAKPRDGSSG
ncbi:alpha/beta fold hydrolase [Xylophilus sp.]|uniref:alpha/beta fold hydrolase n=1 Tax=Xylophilus sp. TaxID=2653893 RepID=UPI0013BA5737|nr:alpha/beta fold hydrolase [Xylophilus sp.]KAF1050195.1 MAG: 2-succinyl-6-hydroxy-2,4-cyclohexadiene-1-carboxylate synthase [Xylophilus sp.]